MNEEQGVYIPAVLLQAFWELLNLLLKYVRDYKYPPYTFLLSISSMVMAQIHRNKIQALNTANI